MSADALSFGEARASGVVELKRSSFAVLGAVLRDPMRGLPTAVFEERVVVGRNFGRVRAYICDPGLIQQVIVRTADALDKGVEANRVLEPALGRGLLTAEGAHWRWQRQTIAPAFQHDKLVAFLPAMIAAAERTRDRWLALPPGSTIDIGHEMMATTFEIIIETMLSGGERIDAALVERSVTDYLRSTSWRFALALLKAPLWVPFPGSRRARISARFMRRSVQDMVESRRHQPGGREDLVALLLAAADPESGRQMSDTEITDNILTFIGAGHETTAVGLSWAFMLLAEEPEAVARVLEEIERVTGGAPLEAAHVMQLAYTRQVVSEAMRLYPPAPLFSRTVTRDLEFEGVSLPKGSIVLVPIYAVHRHRALWEDPERFDPERFAPDAVRARHRYAYMPFGAGPRICIGNTFAMMESVALFAVLVRATRLTRVTPDMPDAAMRITLRPTRPLEMRVSAR